MIFPTLLILFGLQYTAHSFNVLQFSQRAVTPSSKAGLAWANGPYVDMKQFQSTGKVSWYYSWSPDSLDTNLEFVPMLWGQRQVAEFSSTINRTIAARKVSHVLGMNEPELSSQANMTPSQAADMWKGYVEPLKARGLRLGSPASTSGPSGKAWLVDFLTACVGCSIDFIALHWYGINATQFISYLADFHQTFSRPIWVTEWACHNFHNLSMQCSQADIFSFMNETQDFMDKTNWVERYAWFGAMKDLQGVNQDNALVDGRGRLTELGRQYIGAGPGGSASAATESFAVGITTICFAGVMTLFLMLQFHP